MPHRRRYGPALLILATLLFAAISGPGRTAAQTPEGTGTAESTPAADVTAAATPQATATPEPAAIVSVVAPNDVSPDDDEITVEVRVENAHNIAGFQFVLAVDSGLVTAISVDRGPFITSTGREPQCPDSTIEDGAVRMACVTLRNDPPGPDGSGTLATVKLKPNGSGSSPLKLSNVLLAHPDGKELPNRTVDGELTISSGGMSTLTRVLVVVAAGVVVGAAVVVLMVLRRRRRGMPPPPDAGMPTI